MLPYCLEIYSTGTISWQMHNGSVKIITNMELKAWLNQLLIISKFPKNVDFLRIHVGVLNL